MKNLSENQKYNGAIVPKEELDSQGFDYDVYDYLAKMVCLKPSVNAIVGEFRVSGDKAVLLSPTGSHYVVMKINDPKNKDIAFEPIVEEIKIAAKESVFGDTFNIGELLTAIKNPIFVDDAPINIHNDETNELLTMVYECKKCDKLHLLGGELDYDQYSFIENQANRVYSKNPLIFPENHYVLRKDLVDILETLPQDKQILIGLMDDNKVFTLTGVYKCSKECPALHLTPFYNENSHGRN